MSDNDASGRKSAMTARDLRIISAYHAGESQSKIAAREGVSGGLVSLILKKHGARLSAEETMARSVAALLSPENRKKSKRPLKDRFFKQVILGTEPDDCWGWAGACSRDGYPQINNQGRRIFGSHVSLILDGRPRPGTLCALHSCDNPPCCNPRHLWWGTQQENLKDARDKGRANTSGLARGTLQKNKDITL